MDASVNVGQSTQFIDAFKTQAQLNLVFMNALVTGAEQVRAVQLEAARETEAQIGRVAKQVGDVHTFQELLTLQTTLLDDCRRGTVDYWTKLAKAAQQTQIDIAARVQETSNRAFSHDLPNSSESAMPASIQPFTTIVESVFKAASDANAAMLKAIGAKGQEAA